MFKTNADNISRNNNPVTNNSINTSHGSMNNIDANRPLLTGSDQIKLYGE